MKESMWSYLIIALGVSIIGVLIIYQNLTKTSEEDFYLTREVLESSMYDAVDYGTYAKSGKLVMSEDKFVEVFIRRFSESVTNNKDYKINFYDIHEYPPKATVLITTNTGKTKVSSDSFDVNVNTYLNAVLETVSVYKEHKIISKESPTYQIENDDFTLKLRPSELRTNPLPVGTEVVLNYRFMSENDPCGYYISTDVDENTKTEKVSFAKAEINKIKFVDREYEYCEVFDLDNNGYFVRKESLRNK